MLPDCDHPLEMLLAAHERIESQIDTLRRLASHVREHGCDEQAREAAADVLCYFDSAGRYHEDEELELFPRLLRCAAGQSAERAALLVVWLTREHREIDSAWLVHRSQLERIARGQTAELCESAIDRFAAYYRGHIAVEEQQLLPLAAASLSHAELAAMGAAMAKRRGVAPMDVGQAPAAQFDPH